jgi:plastocyanin
VRRLALIALVCLTFPPVPARAADAHVAMVEVRFQPPELRVAVGGTVIWSNDDNMAHEVTADDGSFDSSPTCRTAAGPGCMAPGDTFAHTFPKAGRFAYHCQVHGSPGKGMTGVVTVG